MPDKQETTSSGIPVKAVYTPQDISNLNYEKDLGAPGCEPYTRGPYSLMYRDRPWRIFQLAGYGLPEDENKRQKLLLQQGAHGIEMEPDVMLLYGLLDIDHPTVVSHKEDVGLHGATLLSLDDYEKCLDGIPIETVYAHAGGVTPMASVWAHACYFALAEKRGIDLKQLSGTGEGDMFLAYLATPLADAIPPEAAVRLNCDLIEFCLDKAPKWVPVSIPGTNAAETGLYCHQEIAVTLANAICYIEELLKRGRYKIDDFAHSLGGVGFVMWVDFFENIAMLRAARRMWTKLLKERYGSTDPRSTRMRIHCNVGGSSSTYQQPLNNIIRTTIGSLAGVLGGMQSASITGFDEAICIPSELAHITSVRMHQILQFESGISKVADPLGGSYYVEALTDEMEKKAWEYLAEIEKHGGLISALNSGWLHRETLKVSMENERRMMTGEKKVVGVNCFQMETELFEVPVHRAPEGVYDIAKARLEKLKRERDNVKAMKALDKFRNACASNANVMPPAMEAVKAGITSGEIGTAMREAFGIWKPPLPI